MERVAFSLGNRPSIQDKQHSVSVHLVLAIEITVNIAIVFLQVPNRAQIEHTVLV